MHFRGVFGIILLDNWNEIQMNGESSEWKMQKENQSFKWEWEMCSKSYEWNEMEWCGEAWHGMAWGMRHRMEMEMEMKMEMEVYENIIKSVEVKTLNRKKITLK